jgi:hypothetical protein
LFILLLHLICSNSVKMLFSFLKTCYGTGVGSFLHFLGRCSIAWAMLPAHFALVIFSNRISHLHPGWVGLWFFSHCSISEVTGATRVHHCAQHINWCVVLVIFCIVCSWTMIFPISALQTARITGISHCPDLWKLLLTPKIYNFFLSSVFLN